MVSVVHGIYLVGVRHTMSHTLYFLFGQIFMLPRHNAIWDCEDSVIPMSCGSVKMPLAISPYLEPIRPSKLEDGFYYQPADALNLKKQRGPEQTATESPAKRGAHKEISQNFHTVCKNY